MTMPSPPPPPTPHQWLSPTITVGERLEQIDAKLEALADALQFAIASIADLIEEDDPEE